MWDYLAPSEVVLHSINYPAAVATALIRKPHTLEIGLEYSLWSYTIYLVFVASLWCVIGLFYELSRGTRKGGRWLSWSALICAISALLLAVVTFANWGGQALLLKIAGTLWCVALIVVPIWFLRKLRKQT
jgi:hypothetical protein